MNDYKQIRQRYLNGESQRSIAKSMGISRNTVKKYCEGEKVPWKRKTPEREASVLTEDVLAFITSCLEEDEAELSTCSSCIQTSKRRKFSGCIR